MKSRGCSGFTLLREAERTLLKRAREECILRVFDCRGLASSFAKATRGKSEDRSDGSARSIGGRRIMTARPRGFTFVEMMLATVMLATLSLALYAMLANGIRVWQRTTVDTISEDTHLFFERLEDDCANLTPLAGWQFTTDGTSLQLYCVSEAMAGEGKRVSRVEYRFDPQQTTVERLQRDYPGTGRNNNPGRVMLSGVDSCAFSVFYDDPRRRLSEWSDAWPRENALELAALPRQVRVVLTRRAVAPSGRDQTLAYVIPLRVQE